MSVYALDCHEQSSSAGIDALQVSVQRNVTGALHLRYQLQGDLQNLRIPAPATPAFKEGLWQHTCFELFIATAGESQYREFNFSPAGLWAAFGFSDYRVRNNWQPSQLPLIQVRHGQHELLMQIQLAAIDLPKHDSSQPLCMGLTAVLENLQAECSYWALQHAEGVPDFHHRSGFACILSSS